jgi:hypothetical protein
MQSLLYQFLLGVPQVAAIWVALILLAVCAFAWVFAPGLRHRSADLARQREAARRRYALLRSQTADLSRYAGEVAVAAQRAAAMAERRRAEWLAAQYAAQAAWQSFASADATFRRLAAAAAVPVTAGPATEDEQAARERYLHRAAMAACLRNELSAVDLSDALAHRNGWDPARYPVDQEVFLRRVVRDGRSAQDRRSAERERAAWEACEAAMAQARSLREEAYAAAERAREGEQQLRAATSARQPRAMVGFRPTASRRRAHS